MMRLDLFKIHSYEDSPHGWIWVKFNPNPLREEYLELLEKENQKSIVLKINRNLKAGLSTIEKHLIKLKNSKDKLWLPLPIIIELTNIIQDREIKESIIQGIDSFLCKTSHNDKIGAVKYLNKTFAKIIGAHIADGYLRKENGTYRIKVCDGRRDTVEIFSKWIKETFKSNPIIRFSKKDNTWICWFNNKIIGRYFANILEIPIGKKSHIVREPDLIKRAHFTIRKAFALGVFTFDGGIKTTGMVALSSKSKNLVDDLYNILTLDGIQVKKLYNPKKKFWLLESVSGRNKEYLKKWMDYFEKGTLKHKKLNFFINPSPISINSLIELFPPSTKGKINIIDIYNIVHKKGLSNPKEIIKEISNSKNIAETTVYKYLHILKNLDEIKWK